MKMCTVKNSLVLCVLAVLIFSASCGADKNGHKADPAEPKPPGDVQGEPETTDTGPSEDTDDNQLEIANPASSHCVENGGKLEMKKDEAGEEYGVCKFEDDSRCEEWKFFRKQCAPGDCNEPSGICEK
ncbi:MAG: DUF333 domain-containing protein [Deltaproteobacteria bacterium]|nr:DUF333 domain-containing protein [Deltaproteobacteria bacterium]